MELPFLDFIAFYFRSAIFQTSSEWAESQWVADGFFTLEKTDFG